jgi:hypothetical protein
MTFFDRLEDVVGFAGKDYESATVTPENEGRRRKAWRRWIRSRSGPLSLFICVHQRLVWLLYLWFAVPFLARVNRCGFFFGRAVLARSTNVGATV